jgi:hypothetical protein
MVGGSIAAGLLAVKRTNLDFSNRVARRLQTEVIEPLEARVGRSREQTSKPGGHVHPQSKRPDPKSLHLGLDVGSDADVCEVLSNPSHFLDRRGVLKRT